MAAARSALPFSQRSISTTSWVITIRGISLSFLDRSRCLFACSWHSIRHWTPRRWPDQTKGAEDHYRPRQIPVGRLPRGSGKAASAAPASLPLWRSFSGGAGRLDLVVVVDQVEP